MNENLQAAVQQLIEKSLTAMDSAATFLAAEVPDVVQQLMLWHMAKSGVYFIIGFALLCAVLAVAVWMVRSITRGLKKVDPKRGNWGNYPGTFWVDTDGCLTVGGVGVAVASVLMMGFGVACINLTWLQIWIAPKAWLVEYAARLVR